MFMGEYHPTLDEKCRVAIPVKLRRAYGEDAIINRLVITHGFDKCIMAFREKEWREFVEGKLVTLAETEMTNRKKLRFYVGGASECELDKQGRIKIPPYLKDFAEIDKDVTILGLYNKIEIWSEEKYNSYKPKGESLEDLAKDLGF
ncbi:MAG: division/cell wall cluster transcriptional repressor MraZ [Spirochaetota bacterium]|nr:division/cell wall cluster transcriptional repressor MraZ [Spirochaetota bacterium]